MSLHTSVCTMPILCQLHPVSCTCCILTSLTMIDAAQPPHVHPNELSLHSAHQTLISGVKHCCMLWHLLHPQDLFWECIPHGSLPPDSSRRVWTTLQVVSTCPQHCAKLPMHFNICIWLISLLSWYFGYEITSLLFQHCPTMFLAQFAQCLK